MLRLATCKDLIYLRSKHRDLDEALQEASYRFLANLRKTEDTLNAPDGGDLAWGLKQLGTLYCADRISALKPQTILEVGAGLNTFFDQQFGSDHNYWMIDKSGFYDAQSFTECMAARKHTTYVDGLLGDFSTQLPSDHFDFVFSISVLEHVPFDRLKLVFEDIYRVLKPGGFSVHTIDVNPHSPAANSKDLIQMIRDAGFEFASPPGELDWNVGKIHDPVLLEPLSIVYQYYYKKSFRNPQPDPYLTCYHFGSIILSISKPAAPPTAKPVHGAAPSDYLLSCCTAIDEILNDSPPQAGKPVSFERYQSLSIAKQFIAIQTLLRNDPSIFFKDEQVRNFLYRTFPVNPLIPKTIGNIVSDQLFPLPDHLDNAFLNMLRSSDCPVTITEFVPDITHYRNFLERHADCYKSRFGSNPLHGDVYFFKKTLEHFITYFLIGQSTSADILDVGSAGHQYARMLCQAYPDKKVFVQDLCFPEGVKVLGDNLTQIGGSAASLPLEDSSIDFATFHCSLEHFELYADIDCLREIGRILRPGGQAVIIPLHVCPEYTLVINPITGPFIDNSFLETTISPELNDGSPRIIYTNEMISRFARYYSAHALINRLLKKLHGLQFELCTIEIPDHFSREEILSEEYFGGTYRHFISHERRCFLKFTKL